MTRAITLRSDEMDIRGSKSSAVLLLAVVLALGGCDKSKQEGTAPPSASGATAPPTAASGSAAVRGDAAAATAASAAASEGASPAGAATYGGTYTLAPAPYYIADAKDFSHVKQAKDDPSKHVGEGALSLVVDGAGRVTGTIDSGPAAPAVIDGSLMDGEVRGNVRRKSPEDAGLTGTIVAKIGGAAGEGKLSLAEANASIVRAGAVALKKK